MSPRNRLFVVLAGVVAGVGATWLGYRSWYAMPMGLVRTQIRERSAVLERIEADVAEASRHAKDLAALSATTLGSSEETVASSARTALNEVMARIGLVEIETGTLSAAPIRNPAVEKLRTQIRSRTLRGTPDFYAVSATVKGRGTLEQVVRALATLEAQSWVHRIDGFSVSPKGKDRSQVEIVVSLTTLFLPDLKAPARAGATWTAIGEEQFAPWRAIVDKNVFVRPPPAPVAVAPVQAPQPPPPPPPSDPWADWRISAVVKGRSGPEVWVTNAKSKETITLGLGGTVLEGKVVGFGRESATFEIGNTLFEVSLGQTLAERRPVSR
ncbi:MAG: hypothetical protein JNM07_06975 [Phycisphaerae bacterium]|nr:hypothetical protein [Phycisphaerae bacterium]